MKSLFGRRLLSLALLCLLSLTANAQLPAKLGVYSFPPDLAREVGLNPQGALIYQVVPTSAAGRVELRPGDVITAVNGAPVRNFAQLAEAVRELSAGDAAKLDLRRDGRKATVEAVLSAWIGDLNEDSHRRTLEYLRKLRSRQDEPGPLLLGEIIDQRWELGERAEALDELKQMVRKRPGEPLLQARLLELLRLTGRYEKFIERALQLGKKHPDSAPLQLERADAMLAAGRLADAEEIAAKVARTSLRWPATITPATADALKIWSVARLRRGMPLADPALGAALTGMEWKPEPLAALEYWRRELGQKRPYEITSNGAETTVEFKQSPVLFGLAPYKMHGIAIRVNGVETPLAIVDTGASHTLLSVPTAKAAGVKVGKSGRTAAGSLSFTARAAVVDELQIGAITLRNVPVNVGNPPPLVMTEAKVALGVDLMHHLRFTLDYAKGKVRVEPAQTTKLTPPEHPEAVWDIPLYTFADHCMAQARLADGGRARVLIDSGNFAQTLVWPAWAKQHIENHPGPASSMLVYALGDRQQTLRGIELGGRKLPDWPALDMPPITLDGIDLLDLLMGHDLLSQYAVTIDMQNRRLRLVSAGKSFTPPKPRSSLGL